MKGCFTEADTGEDLWCSKRLQVEPNKQWTTLHCFALKHFSRLRWWHSYLFTLQWVACLHRSSFVLTLYREIKNFSWYSSCFLLLLWSHANSAKTRDSFWIEPLLLICVWCLPVGLECHHWFGFDVLHWTADILAKKIDIDQSTSKEHIPLVLLTNFCPLPLLSGL